MFNFVKKYLSENTGILIRLDDIAENMNWPLMERCEVLFDKYNIKPLLGVISNNKDPKLLSYPRNESFWSQVRAWKDKKWEISMCKNSVLKRVCALPRKTQRLPVRILSCSGVVRTHI